MKKNHMWVLRAAAMLWVLWGLVHVLAGVLTMSLDPAAAVAGIADAVNPESLSHLTYHAAAGAVLKQHGWNLAWIGATTLISSVFIWRGSKTASWVAALVGGMADLGYFLFLDLPGFVRFVPGTVMTFISSAAIVLSAWVSFSQRTNPKANP